MCYLVMKHILLQNLYGMHLKRLILKVHGTDKLNLLNLVLVQKMQLNMNQ